MRRPEPCPSPTSSGFPFGIRLATDGDEPVLCGIIARSLRVLSEGLYTPDQVEGALQGACAVDTQLLRDGTYFVVTDGDRIVACGGWSYRQTLFGGDAREGRDPELLDPAVDAAKIRAFFVDPDYARRGIGRVLVARCEAEARRRGFSRFELMSTLPGIPLYRKCGYEPGEPIRYPLPNGLDIEFVPMHKVDGGAD